MKQFRHKLAQRKGTPGFCREFAPIKWGGVCKVLLQNGQVLVATSKTQQVQRANSSMFVISKHNPEESLASAENNLL